MGLAEHPTGNAPEDLHSLHMHSSPKAMQNPPKLCKNPKSTHRLAQDGAHGLVQHCRDGARPLLLPQVRAGRQHVTQALRGTRGQEAGRVGCWAGRSGAGWMLGRRGP